MNDVDPFDLAQVRAFDAVARLRSFTRAAATLGTAQSSVSQQVRRLEAKLGQDLLARSTRNVELTPAGEAMLVYSRSMLSLADRARQQLARPPLEGSLRLGLVEDFATARLATVLSIFRKQHPRLELTFSTGLNYTLFEALDSQELDVVLAKRPIGNRRGNLVFVEALVWVGDPNLVEPNRYVPLVTYPAPSDTRDVILQALKDAGYTWNVVVQSTGLFGQAAAVQAGLGVGVFTSHFVPQGLVELPADIGLPKLPPLEYVIDLAAGEKSDALTFFVDALTGVARQMATSGGGDSPQAVARS